jgi:hypothetical protein
MSKLYGLSLITDTIAGSHFIVPAALLSKNFNVSYELGALTILEASLSITADDKVIKAGDPLPTFTSTIAGLVNKETPSMILTGPVTHSLDRTYAGAGTYTITPAATLKEPSNYTASYTNGKLYVNPYGTGTKAVRPFLYCVEELTEPVNGFYYVAHFGYKNLNSVAVVVAHGDDNQILSEGSYSGESPTIFPPGEGTFDLYFDGSRTTWILKSTENTKKTSMASVASSGSNRCNRFEKATGINVEAMYPNPVVDNLKILLNDIPQQVSASCYNELTAKTYNMKVSGGQYANEVIINMQSLPAGLYYMKFLANNKVFSFRIMKQ